MSLPIRSIVNPEAKLSAMCAERSDLRNEIMGFEQSLHKAMFAFFALLVAFAGLYLGGEISGNDRVLCILLFAIANLEFFIAVFVLGIAHCVNVTASYISTLEKHINHIAGEKIARWQIDFVPAHITVRGSPFIISMVMLTVLFFLFLTGLHFSVFQRAADITESLNSIYLNLGIVIAVSEWVFISWLLMAFWRGFRTALTDAENFQPPDAVSEAIIESKDEAEKEEA